MNLYQTYSKIIIKRNHLKYLWVTISILLSYIVITFATIYINNILSLSIERDYSKVHYIFISVLTIIYIAGFTSIIYQYYNIMKSGIGDYYILMKLGATKKNIRFLISIQAVLLIIISIPIGLFCGYIITESMMDFISYMSLNKYIVDQINSSTNISLAALGIGIFIIAIGLYIERIVCKMPISNILSGKLIISREGDL